jgi:hypothetical protein
MGCAASVDDTPGDERRKQVSVRSAAYDTNTVHPAVATAETPLHAAYEFNSYATPDDPSYDALLEYEFYTSRHCAASDGGAAEEPSAFSRGVSESLAVVAARLRHGINGDPEQFQPGAESASSVAQSVQKAERWLALGGTPATATSGSAGELGLGPVGSTPRLRAAQGDPLRPPVAGADVAEGAATAVAVDDTPRSAELLELQPSFSSPGLTMGGVSFVDAIDTQSPSRRLTLAAAGPPSAHARVSADALKIFSPQSLNQGRCAPTTSAVSRTRSIGDFRSASSTELVRSMSGHGGSAPLSRSALAAHNARTAAAAAAASTVAISDQADDE